MKDYVQNVKPLIIKNTIIKDGIVKQSVMQKMQTPRNLPQPHQKLCELFRESASKDKHIATINRKKSRKFVAEKIIDLHGSTREKALENLYIFFEQCRRENIRNVLVITGGNAIRQSTIRSLFQQWMREYFSQYVSAYGQASASHGGEGAFYVILKNKTQKDPKS
jgi:DNA-nicking Smr family endonuclease